MDIEVFIGIEDLLNLYLYPEIINIILSFLDFENRYNSTIDNNILAERKISKFIANDLRIQFDIEYHIEYILNNILEHCERWQHPKFIDIKYNKTNKIDFQFEITYSNWVWEIVGNIEPDSYLDCDCY